MPFNTCVPCLLIYLFKCSRSVAKKTPTFLFQNLEQLQYFSQKSITHQTFYLKMDTMYPAIFHQWHSFTNLDSHSELTTALTSPATVWYHSACSGRLQTRLFPVELDFTLTSDFRYGFWSRLLYDPPYRLREWCNWALIDDRSQIYLFRWGWRKKLCWGGHTFLHRCNHPPLWWDLLGKI